MSESRTLFSLPEHVRAQIARAADAEDTTPQEWVQRAVTRQLDAPGWRGVLAYGDQRVRALGYTEDAVERLISASRRDARAWAEQERGGRIPPR